jgi:hypothetical protein
LHSSSGKFTSQNRKNARLFLQSSELGPPHTHSPTLVGGGGTHSDEGTVTVVL